MEFLNVQFENNMHKHLHAGGDDPSAQSPKAKILMLHGHGQSGRVFYHKTKKIIQRLQKSYRGEIELFYPNAPGHATDDVDADIWVWGNGDFQDGSIRGIDESIVKVLGILHEHGPFVGIVGFSTGAALAAIVTALLERRGPLLLAPGRVVEIVHPPLRFAVCFSGFKLGNPSYEKLYSPQIQTPMMHVIASLDTMIPEQQTRQLIEQCATCCVELFYGTHYVPQSLRQTSSTSSLLNIIATIACTAHTIHRQGTPTEPHSATMDPSKYSLYIFFVMRGCIAFLFIGIGIHQMYSPIDRDNAYLDIPPEQRTYMRRVRQWYANDIAVVARRPDFD
ncbi:serine hydrolase-domain-containing protein [Aspergillus californicus]